MIKQGKEGRVCRQKQGFSKYTLVREEVTVKVTFDENPEGTGLL